MRTPVLTAEEGGDEPGHLRGAVEQEQVTSTPDDVISAVEARLHEIAREQECVAIAK